MSGTLPPRRKGTSVRATGRSSGWRSRVRAASTQFAGHDQQGESRQQQRKAPAHPGNHARVAGSPRTGYQEQAHDREHPPPKQKRSWPTSDVACLWLLQRHSSRDIVSAGATRRRIVSD